MNNAINLFDLIALDNKELNKKYLKYYLHFTNKKQYRSEEIDTIKSLINSLKLDYENAKGFYYSYQLPHLNKELDLLKITKKSVVNIELKSMPVSLERIEKQLRQNRYYLNLFHKKIYTINYCSFNNKVYEYIDDSLVERDLIYLRKILIANSKPLAINLDDIFSPLNMLISPIHEPIRFLNNDYLLTDSQQMVKGQLIKSLMKNESVSLTGSSGTGKTLLLYDIAKNINKKILIIEPFKIIEGHKIIMDKYPNIIFKEINDDISKISFNLLIVDEVQRLSYNMVRNIINNINNSNKALLVSYDEKQRISNTDEFISIITELKGLTLNNNYRLSQVIRTNKDISLFLNSLFNSSKKISLNDNIRIKYVGIDNLYNEINESIKSGYSYISYLDSKDNYPFESMVYTKDSINKEFDNVCMVLDNRFYYENDKLKSKVLDDNLIYTRILYQGLSKARRRVLLLVTDQELLKTIINFVN